MPHRKLGDSEVERLRELAAAGRDRDELASEFGVSRRHVDRLVRGDQRRSVPAADGAVSAAVRAYVAGADLDPADRVLAEVALTLAAKLDGVRANDAVGAAAAAPALARELGQTLSGLRGEAPDAAALLREMLAPIRGVS